MADAGACEVVTVFHDTDRRVDGWGVCGQPATHRYVDGDASWMACRQHAQATWDVLEEDQGQMEPLEADDG